MSAPSLEWFAGLSKEEQENFTKSLLAAGTVLRRLRDILSDHERTLQAGESKLDDFSDPNWAYKQAYRNGRKAQIRLILQLLSFLKG